MIQIILTISSRVINERNSAASILSSKREMSLNEERVSSSNKCMWLSRSKTVLQFAIAESTRNTLSIFDGSEDEDELARDFAQMTTILTVNKSTDNVKQS